MTPAETIRILRGSHTRAEYPVAHCRKCHQNWPCDVNKALDAAAAAEKERIIGVLRASPFDSAAEMAALISQQPGGPA